MRRMSPRPTAVDDPVVARALRIGARAGARIVLAALVRRLGVIGALGALARVGAWKARGAPFRALGPARDERERLSRAQAGDLVLLDRAVRCAAGPDVALAVAREAVLGGAVPFLDAMIPRFSAERLAAVAPELVARFFNAEGEARVIDGVFHFDVARCRFVELLDAVDARHLAPLFCEADHAFFGGGHRPVTLRRSRTIAGGAAGCDFQFEPAPGGERGAPGAPV